MSNYKQSNIVGTSWVRCRAVTINNPYPDPNSAESTPKAWFQEQQVVQLPEDKVILNDIGHCLKVFNPETEITLLDPETGAPTGATVTHGYLYQILYSLYLQTALERDNG